MHGTSSKHSIIGVWHRPSSTKNNAVCNKVQGAQNLPSACVRWHGDHGVDGITRKQTDIQQEKEEWEWSPLIPCSKL